MPDANPLIEHVIDLLSDWGAVAARERSGRWELYHQSLMFGMVAGDALYFKVDDANRERFLASGGRPLACQGATGKAITLSYWTPPDTAMDEPEELAAWAQGGFEAAQRAQAGRKPRRAHGGVPRG